MTRQHQIYKCEICGNIVEVLHSGAGQLVCCGQAMKLIEEKDKDEGKEKHLPVMEILPADDCKVSDGVKIKIGEIPHPMEENHHIEWVEIKTNDNKTGKKFLNPGDVPEINFHTRAKILEIRVYCNIHGLWKLLIA
ncbi:MAG: desulfoferrodoxin [Patescibacteria group bacterium]|nr:desulfoferrodoxin [Patescibacteria group bacterium]MDD5172696.1 desulfoferrodoxin [Patescibacteria group bacterium]